MCVVWRQHQLFTWYQTRWHQGWAVWLTALWLGTSMLSRSSVESVNIDHGLICRNAVMIDEMLRCDEEGRGEGLHAGDRSTQYFVRRPLANRPPTSERMSAEDLEALEQRLNINASRVEDLMSLPGIGPALAERIVKARPYGAVGELTRVKGVGPKRLNAIARRCTVDSHSLELRGE